MAGGTKRIYILVEMNREINGAQLEMSIMSGSSVETDQTVVHTQEVSNMDYSMGNLDGANQKLVDVSGENGF